VSGKGIAAALLMAFVRPIMRSALDRTGDPVEALERTNHILVHERPTGLFVTVLAGVLDLDSGRFTFASAGHERPLLAPPFGAEPTWVEGCGPLLGLFDTLGLEAQSIELRPDDRLVLYTDGITDAMAPDRSRFGEARFLRAVADSCAGGAAETSRAVISDVLAFQGDTDPADDLALLVLRRLPPSP
jgi:sigma-B regulation protein RsbU (phosphoserine phosphatase)